MKFSELSKEYNFIKVIKYINERFPIEVVDSWMEENCENYVYDGEREDYCEENDIDECDDVPSSDIYRNYCMGGAITYDAIYWILNHLVEKYPEEYNEYEDEVDEYVEGLCGGLHYDSLTHGSTDIYYEFENIGK